MNTALVVKIPHLEQSLLLTQLTKKLLLETKGRLHACGRTDRKEVIALKAIMSFVAG